MGFLKEVKYINQLKFKLIEKQTKNLSDSEIERCFAGTVLANKNIKFAKQFRDNNTLKL